MILTVTMNASIDKRYVLKDAQEGEVNRVLSCENYPGGKGLNVSKAAARAGADVTATGLIGGHAGDFIAQSIEDYKVVPDFHRLDAESRSCINIWDEDKRVQTEYLEPGFTVNEKDYEEYLKKFRELVEKADVVAMSGSLPKGLGADAYAEMIDIVKAAGKKVILDTSGATLEEAVKAGPNLIKPNIDEIRMLTGSRCDEKQEIIDAAKKLHEDGVEYVAVSLGGDGSLLVCEDGIFQAKVPKIDAVNTVGCGDSMIAGFAMGFEDHMSPEENLKRASAIATAVAMSEETGLFNPEDFDDVYPKIEIERLA